MKMLQKYKSMNAAAWILLFGIVVTIQWTTVTSATITTDVPVVDLKSESSEEQNHVQMKNDKNLFYSDELDSTEYDYDLDADSTEQRRQQDHEWDLLVFTQQWPITTCYHWREEDKNHRCTLPSKSEFWTIHGVWPTKLGHIGPGFCNKTTDFNLDILQPIVDRLELFWPEIDAESNFDYLWKHEWLKHGTCAAELEALNNELKYFGQGLKWRNEYLMGNILAASGIHPDSNNTVVALHTAVVQALRKNPSIHCIYDNKNDVSYLSEIRMCFDKSLELVDCDGVKLGDAISIDYPGGNVNTNCHISKPVHYPSLVPQRLREQNDNWKFPIVNIYKLLQFVMWFTL